MPPTTKTAVKVALVLLALATGLSSTACRDDEPVVRDAGLASDTRDGRGPFEIVVGLEGGDVESATLSFRAGDAGAWASVGMEERAGRNDELVGLISPFGYRACDACEPRHEPWPLGTRIDWFVTLTGDGVEVREPATDGAFHTFYIGEATQGISVDEIVPDEGPASGGTVVLIRGSGFRPEVELRFDDQVADDVVVVSPELIRAVTPPHAAGPADVVVSDVERGVSGVLPDGFFYIAPPNLVAVDPDEGPITGGTSVSLTGSDFDAETVLFGGLEATIQSRSDTRVDVVTPPHEEGPVDVTIINRDGQSDTLADGYLYLGPPVIEEVVPPLGPSSGGTSVEIRGRNFRAGLTVRFDGPPMDCTLIDSTRLACVTVPHVAGFVDVTVVNADGQRGVLPDGFEFLDPPDILSIEPDEGPITGGTPVSIRGTGFHDQSSVEIGGVQARQCTTISTTLIECVTPPYPTPELVDVRVVNPDGQSDTLVDGFEYLPPPPEIISVMPDEGPDTGGTRVTIRVDWLQPGAGVRFGDAECVVESVDVDTGTIVCVTQAHPEGWVDVTVTNGDGQQDTLEDGFRFLGPPRILSISPDQGPDRGGTRVTITGENFVEGMTVTFDGIQATVVSVDERNGTVIVTTPPHPRGFVDVTVQNPDGRSDTAPDGFEYIWPPPQITRLAPPEGPTWGGGRVVIHGVDFRADAEITVAGMVLPATQIRYVDATRIEILSMPAGAPGQVLVEVTHSDGQSDAASYTYVPIRVEPPGGLTGGFTRVELTGFDFVAGTNVQIAGAPPESVTVVDPNTIVVQTAPGPVGGQPLVVTLPDGRSEDVRGGFTYRRFIDTTPGSGIDPSFDCQATELVDLDRDGDLDLVSGLGGWVGMEPKFVDNMVERNNGLATFSRWQTLSPGERTINIAVADFDGDGDADVLDINLDDITRMFRNDGTGQLSVAPGVLPFPADSVYDAKFIDYDRDNDLDLVLAPIIEGEILFENIGGSYINVPGAMPADNVLQEHDHDVSVGDVDGNGWDDVLIGVDNTPEFGGGTRFAGRTRLLRLGPNGFRLDTSQPFTARRGDVLDTDLVDIDGDNDLDVLVTDNILDEVDPIFDQGRARRALEIYVNDGNGQFSVETVARLPARGDDWLLQGAGVTPIDLDADGDQDLILSTVPDSNAVNAFGADPNVLLVNDGEGFFHPADTSWTVTRDPTIEIEAGDLDGDGHPDLVFCNFDSANRVMLQRAR